MPLCAKKLRIITFSCKIFKNQYLMYEKLRIVTFFLQECYKSLLFPTKSYKSLLFCKKKLQVINFLRKIYEEKVTNRSFFVRKSYESLLFRKKKLQIVTFFVGKVTNRYFSLKKSNDSYLFILFFFSFLYRFKLFYCTISHLVHLKAISL